MAILVTSFSARAQLHEYTFNGNLNGSYGSTPPLVENLACGASNGSFVTEPVISTAGTCSANATVFSFNAGGGLQYNNAGFISNTYTIHLFFKFSTYAGGYARVIDFLNSCCDAGMYIVGNCLNFYPNGNVGTCPYFVDGNYYLISLTRNGASDEVKIYVNGALFSIYNDAANTYASAGGTTPIILFRDDNAFGCEARDGRIRYLSLSPLLSTDAQVLNVWNNICTVILPVSLKSFNAAKINQSDVSITWQTASEINNSYFSIERSSDAVNFFPVAKVNAQNGSGVNNYSFTDKSAKEGMNYYRLKQVDIDGKVVYSYVVKVFIENSNRTVQVIYRNGIWLSSSTEWLNSKATLLTANSQVIKTFEINKSLVQMNLNAYPAGIYYILIQKDNNRITQKIIKH